MKMLKSFFMKIVQYAVKLLELLHIRKHDEHASSSQSRNSIKIFSCYIQNQNKIKDLIIAKFPDFPAVCVKHYNKQLDFLHQDFVLKAKKDDELQLAIDYFERNRSRLFEWWCMRNSNIISSNEEFQVRCDLYGFDDAFVYICKKMFDIDVKPDEDYSYGMSIESFAALMRNSNENRHCIRTRS